MSTEHMLFSCPVTCRFKDPLWNNLELMDNLKNSLERLSFHDRTTAILNALNIKHISEWSNE